MCYLSNKNHYTAPPTTYFFHLLRYHHHHNTRFQESSQSKASKQYNQVVSVCCLLCFSAYICWRLEVPLLIKIEDFIIKKTRKKLSFIHIIVKSIRPTSNYAGKTFLEVVKYSKHMFIFRLV